MMTDNGDYAQTYTWTEGTYEVSSVFNARAIGKVRLPHETELMLGKIRKL
jgi:hypothetical protein